MHHGILIVDDNSSVRRSLRSLLQLSAGWDICGEAENGAAAVEMVEKLHPDVVVLDLAMPIMNGLESAREISKIHPHPHIVLYTLHASDQLQSQAREAGIDSVLPKTSQGCRDLLALLGQWLLPDPGSNRKEANDRTTSRQLESSHQQKH